MFEPGEIATARGRRAGMADLKIDYQLLEQANSSLSSLVGEFDNIQAVQDGYDGALGSGDIAGAINGFAGNWDYHRKQLVGSMQALQKMVQETRQQFRKTDNDLKQGLTTKKK
jgi:hypothetical protein